MRELSAWRSSATVFAEMSTSRLRCGAGRPFACAPPVARAALNERFGPRWFEEPRAGEFLRGLWRRGQGADGAEGILAAVGGSQLDFGVLLHDLGVQSRA